MKLFLLLLLVLSTMAADPQQPGLGGKELIVSTNGYAGVLNVRTQLNVGYTGQAGLMTMSSTNGTYVNDFFVDSDGTFRMTDEDAGTNLFSVPNPSGYTGTGTMPLMDGNGYSWNEKVVNVKTFGAIGDDSHDDTTAIQAAINLITSQSTPRNYSTLVFPAGVYKTTSPLIVTNAIRIQGYGLVGALDFSPLEVAGSMIRYYGTTGAAIQIGKDSDFTYHIQIYDMRFGAAGQSPRPDGVILNQVSEATIFDVQSCCGFNDGFIVKGCTITELKVLSAANRVGMLVVNSTNNIGFSNCSLDGSEFYQNSTAHLQIAGGVRNLSFDNGWMENAPIAIWVPPPTNLINSVSLMEFNNTGFHGYDSPNARVLKIDGGTTTNNLYIESIAFRDCFMYVGATNAVDLLMANNTGGLSSISNIEFDNIQGYAITNALVYSDTLVAGSSVRFSGIIKVLEGFGDGTAHNPFIGAGTPTYDLNSSLSYRDFSYGVGQGKLWRLPSGPVLTYTEGLWGYDPSHQRPFWSVGTSVTDLRFVAEVNASHVLLDNVDPITIIPLTVNSNEFGYLDGVTSSIQTQLNSKASANSTVPRIPYLSSAGVFSDSPLGVSSGNVTMAAATTNSYFFLGTGAFFDASGQFELNSGGGAAEVHFSPWSTTAPFYLSSALTIGPSTAFFNLLNNHTNIFQMVGDGTTAFYGDIYSTPGLKQLGLSANPWTNTFSAKLTYNGNVFETYGTGSPEGVVTASIGSEYHRIDGGSGTSVYIKETGSGNTGWVGISSGSAITSTYSELFNKTGGLFTNAVSYGLIDFTSGNDMQITLPSAGTYKVEAEVDYWSGGSTFTQYYKFRNIDDASDIANSERIVDFPAVSASKDHLFTMCNIITVAASKTIGVYSKVVDITYDHMVNATNCAIRYIKISN